MYGTAFIRYQILGVIFGDTLYYINKTDTPEEKITRQITIKTNQDLLKFIVKLIET